VTAEIDHDDKVATHEERAELLLRQQVVDEFGA
jgi:hypothetical protein